MNIKRGNISLLVLLLVLIAGFSFVLLSLPKTNNQLVKIPFVPAPTPYQFPYKNPAIPKSRSYRIVIVGDSIVASLGLNANVLREYLIKYYPDSEFVTYNFGYPSTNVLTLYQRLKDEILKEGIDLIIVESFGYNPLSEYSISEGLAKQDGELEKSVRLILSEKPVASLAFMTPIAPDSANFARGSRELSDETRKAWVEERIAYIDNHRNFAEVKGIPVIDVYKASLKADGSVDRTYISDDFIHPSKKGIDLMSKLIADYIFENKIFPE